MLFRSDVFEDATRKEISTVVNKCAEILGKQRLLSQEVRVPTDATTKGLCISTADGAQDAVSVDIEPKGLVPVFLLRGEEDEVTRTTLAFSQNVDVVAARKY